MQSEAWPLSSGRAACEGFPQHKPLPCTSCPISSYPRQLPVTDHPPGAQEDTGAAHLEPTTAPVPHQTQVQHRNPQLASGSVWHHCALSKWVLCLVSPASQRQRGGFGGLYGRARNGADRTTLSWGRLSHKPSQPAPSAHTPSSTAITTLTEPATVNIWLTPGAGRQAGITREAPTSYTAPWSPPGLIQTAALLCLLPCKDDTHLTQCFDTWSPENTLGWSTCH